MDTKHTQMIRTYGRRQGRPIKSSKQKLFEELLPTLAIDLVEGKHLLDPKMYFNQQLDIWMEVGFGGGEHLASLAQQNPSVNFIGCEPFLNGVSSLLGHIDEHAIKNIRIYQGNAVDLIKTLALESLSRFYLMFADPWPKKRHNKRRFVQPEILDIVISRLKIGAQLRLATDHEDYQVWMLKHLQTRPDLQEVLNTFDKPNNWPDTRYESKALEEGRKPLYLVFERLN